MKKLLIITFISVVAFAACKKEKGTISKEVTPSFPVFTYPQGQYFSIPVHGTVPTVSVTAKDTVLGETLSVTDTGTVDNTTPGLYVLTAIAKNSNGYQGTGAIYIAVTDVSPAVDLTGQYVRQSNLVPVNVTKLATGLYVTDNVGGVAPPSSAIIPALFVQIDDTTILVPPQPTSAGTLYCKNAKLNMSPGDTTYQYVVVNSTFGTSTRVFKKQ